MENKKYKFSIGDMHCKSCALVIEEEVKKINGVDSVFVDFYKNELEVFSSLEKDENEFSKILNDAVAHHGYKISVNKLSNETDWYQFVYAVPISIAIILIFSFIQKIGLVNFLNTSGGLDYSSVFLIGFVASLSSCLAVVGGLVLSFSVNQAKEGGKILSQLLFHIGRIIGFFILGGVIGVLGNSFYLTINMNIVISLILSIVMFILGLNLLNIFNKTKNIQILMPKLFGQKVLDSAKSKNYLSPIFIGVATFFLPCGFTQSMQMYALSTHDFWRGAFVMLVFALGTLPVLLIISLTSFRFSNKKWSGVFYKTTGIIIIILSIFNMIGALSAYGIITPFLNI